MSEIEYQLSKESLDYLELMNKCFGELFSDFMKERLYGLSKENQMGLCWHVLHYVYRDEILSTGNPHIDVLVAEVIEKMPLLGLECLRFFNPKLNDHLNKILNEYGEKQK